MKPENQEKLLKLIESNVSAGLVRGQQLFAESLEEDLTKSDVIEKVQLEGVMEYLLSDYIDRSKNN